MKLNLTSEFITLTTCFFCPVYYHVDFSRRAGDFRFKLVASSKILVAMATKMVATGGLLIHIVLSLCCIPHCIKLFHCVVF